MPTNVLLVEDTEGIRRALAEILRLEGYEVTIAIDGDEALKKLRSGTKASVILLDMIMPRMDGAALVGELKKNPEWAAIPTIVMSARDGAQAPMPADAFLSKPINLDALFSLLERYR